jgi:hypothetical protein
LNTETLDRQIDEIAAMRREARLWRLGTMAVSIVGMTVCLLVLRHSALKLVEPGPSRDEFVSQLQANMGQQVVPEVQALTAQTFDRLMPRVKREFVKLQLRVPEAADKFRGEIELLQSNVIVRAEKPLQLTLNRVLQSREAQLRATFPELTEKRMEVLVSQLLDEGEEHLANIVTPIVTPYQHTLTAIMENLESIRASEEPALANDTPEWEVTFLCLNLLKDELKNLDTDRLRLALNEARTQKETR